MEERIAVLSQDPADDWKIIGTYVGDGATDEGQAPSNLELAKSFYDLEKSWKGAESDPLGKDQHEGGAKLDAGKPRVALVMRDFAHALWEVARVGTYGAEKYCASGWMDVPDGINRYDDAMMRHKLKDWMGEKMDTDLPVEHLAQVAWNALATLERRIREEKDSKA